MTDVCRVLDKGEVRLIDWMGSDLSVVRAARVSTGSTPEDASKGPEKDEKLIRYLMRNNHGSPFEHNAFTFYVKAPLFVAREWFRHRISSYNEISARYSVLADEFYVPALARRQAPTNRQNSVPFIDENVHNLLSEAITDASRSAYDTYERLLEAGVARELARIILPLNTYTQWYWTVNARALMNFLSLRTHENAQQEIREYATAVEEMWADLMPVTHAAWSEGR